MDFLSEIIEVKRRRVAAAKQVISLEELRFTASKCRAHMKRHRLVKALYGKNKTNIIAEFKRRSPSKGAISESADAAATAIAYERGGAVAISVLTEEDHFGGSLDDLCEIRKATPLTVLRKDFIVEEYQVYESAAAQADALLLIVAALDDTQLRNLLRITDEELGMDALVEVHTAEEMTRAGAAGAHIIGVNNRDLRTFEVSTATSQGLAAYAPATAVLVSESGLNAAAISDLRATGYHGFLVGESLMRSDDPGQTLRTLIENTNPRAVSVKICGITNIEDAKAAIEAGADMLGFNFYPKSKRYLDVASARTIIEEARTFSDRTNKQVVMIGVFVNETADRIFEIVQEVGLDGVQLHGDETIEFCHHLDELVPQMALIKALPATKNFDVASIRDHPANIIILDAFEPRVRGGTGELADWQVAREIAAKATSDFPLVFLAGGLSPENVAKAITTVRPHGVDACSALEVSPGKKDHARVREFVAAARASKLRPESGAM